MILRLVKGKKNLAKNFQKICRSGRRFSAKGPEEDNKPLGDMNKDDIPEKKLTKIDHFIALGRYKRQTGSLLLFSPCLWGVMINAPVPLSSYESKKPRKSKEKL